MILKRVPSLDGEIVHKIREFVREKVIPTRGVVSNPRPFAPEDHEGDEQVKYTIIVTVQLQVSLGELNFRDLLIFHMHFVHTHWCQ